MAPIAATLVWWLWQWLVVTRDIRSRYNYYFGGPLVINSAVFLTIESLARLELLTLSDSLLELIAASGGALGMSLAWATWLIVFVVQRELYTQFLRHPSITVEKVFLGFWSNLVALLAYVFYIRIIGIWS